MAEKGTGAGPGTPYHRGVIRRTSTFRRSTLLPRALFATLLILALPAARAAVTDAKALFEAANQSVFQIRVIDLASGDKFSLGSGFRVGEDGRLATNFHVVSSYVHEPEKYRLEAVDFRGTVLPLDLRAIDVVHDLAIVSATAAGGDALSLGAGELAKGDRIYSMGNPLDLGMTIIEGTYNGLVENSRYRNILFSGSLNSGMSGGPALDATGAVIGVNVSKGGEQISFVVPVRHLAALLEKSESPPPPAGFDAEITAALLADQQAFYGEVLASDTTRMLGDLRVVGKLHDSLRCWGHAEDEPDEHYTAAHQHCTSEDEIFVSNELLLGDFRYDVELVSSAGLNRFQFYNLLEEEFEHRSFHNTTDSGEVTPYECHEDALALDSGNWKISSCVRAYRKLTGLFDASMVMISLDDPDRAALVKTSASGISRENALALFRKMVDSVAWTR